MIYLDNSATSYPKPDVVYDFMNSFYKEHGVSPGRAGYDAGIETGEVLTDCRRLLTKMFNGGTDERRLTFSYNATDSLNMLIQGLVRKGGHVITTMLEHNSVLRPLYHMELAGITEVTYLPFDEAGYVHPEDFEKAIKPNTNLIVCTQCSNVIGTVQPIKEIGKVCKEHGITFVVDGSQGAGAVVMDMIDYNVDAYAFTGHKCLMGPTGIGGSYVREGVEVIQTRFGGTGVRSAQRTHLEEYPYRLETGTINMLGISGLYAGAKWVLEHGIENIHAQEMKLWKKLRDGIRDVEGVTVYCATTTENQNPVLSINIKGFESIDVGTMLDVDYNIACRTGLQCAPLVHERLGTLPIDGTVRLSIGAFNTEADIDACIEAVKEIAALKN